MGRGFEHRAHRAAQERTGHGLIIVVAGREARSLCRSPAFNRPPYAKTCRPWAERYGRLPVLSIGAWAGIPGMVYWRADVPGLSLKPTGFALFSPRGERPQADTCLHMADVAQGIEHFPRRELCLDWGRMLRVIDS